MKYALPIIILVTFLVIMIGANIYLSRRFNWYFSVDNTRILYFLFGFVSIFMLFGTMAFTNGSSFISSILYGMATISLGFMIFLLFSTILTDLFGLAVKLKPKHLGLIALSLASLLSVYGIWNAFNIRTTNQEVVIPALKNKIRAVHLTDIHIGHFRGEKFLAKVVERTNAETPDVVFLTGDLFDGRVRLNDETLAPLKNIKAPVFFVEGNHDNYSGIKEIKHKLRQIGVRVLENERVDWNGIQITGLNHMLADTSSYDMHSGGKRQTIESVLDVLKPGNDIPNILLHHSPDGVQYANKHGVDLYLAGHTHAGQLFPINQVGRLIFDYNRGMHDYKGTKIFVSQGIGTFGPPMRVGTKSELAVLTLKPG